MTSAEVTKAMLPPSLHIEVREKQNGSWAVFYPDPGFIPCAPNCAFGQRGQPFSNHKHEYAPKWIESEYKPTSYDDALAWGQYLSDGREVKVLRFVPLSERRKNKTEDA